MGRIPTVTSGVSANSLDTNAQIGARRASGDAFGANVGRALQTVGAGIDAAAQGVKEFYGKRAAEDVANKVAQADFTRRELEIRNEVGPDAAGYQERVLEEYDTWVDEQAEEIEDDEARTLFKNRMNARRPSLSSRSAQYEFGTAASNSKEQADMSLIALDNKIRVAPDRYDDFIEEGFAVIDARADIPAHVRNSMKNQWKQGAALSRFEGALEAATTAEDVQAIEDELREGDRDWTQELSSAGMERILGLASSAKTAIVTKADADARAALDTLEKRAADVTSLIPREELQAVQDVVANSNNPVTQARMIRVIRDQELAQQLRKLTPEQQRTVINQRYNAPSLPPRVNNAINHSARMFGVSPAYLASTAQREYGMHLKGDNIDYGKGNAEGASSALGIMQFLDDTWLGVVRNNAFLQATGLNIAGMSEQELLDLRKDPDIAIMGGAFFTAQNARAARSVLGRPPNDAELYIMHFMGQGGGTRLFRLMQSNPDMSAAHLFPEQAKANPTIFHKKDGSDRTVREVYSTLGAKHATGEGSETYHQYADRQTANKMLDDTERRLADDPMSFALQAGTAAVGDIFGEGGMAARGEAARSVADYYSIPMEDMKPFTQEEAAALSKQIKEGSADEVLGVVTSVQQMGGEIARAALAQIAVSDDVYGFAGGLQLETGQGAVAADVIRGQKRLEENPAIRSQMGVPDYEIGAAFVSATGGALLDADPGQRQSIMDAAIAHYVETQMARGRADGFDEDLFSRSVQAVLGGREGAPAMEDVNGAMTILPPGVSGASMEAALQNMTLADWAGMSAQGEPPRYITGAVADPETLADEAQLRAIGGGQYRVAVSDGSYLITGRPAANGQLEPFVMVPTADKVKEINDEAARQAAADNAEQVEQDTQDVQDTIDQIAPQRRSDVPGVDEALEDGVITPEESAALFEKYGVRWMFDDEGNRIMNADGSRIDQ